MSEYTQPSNFDGRTNPVLIVPLKFSSNKGQASQFMEGHKEWIKRGVDDDVFFVGRQSSA